jgi:hypothetical protein
MPTSTLTDELAALARPLAKKLVRREDARRARIVDGVTGGGTRVILGEGTTGNLPSNQHGTIEDISVLVDFPAYSLAQELQTLLGEIIADLATGAGVTVEETDASPSGVARTVVVPAGSLVYDAATETATLSFTAAAISGQYRSVLYTLDGAGGFNFVVDGDGHPMYVLRGLE